MTEILTESFCERCGTRYTFETVQPKRRGLGKIGTLGRGFRHFVSDPGSSLDEAFAVAKSEQEQRSTNTALEAFHRTFNFCLSCRQYTCGDCWNAVEGRCLSCAPTAESLEPPPPRMDTAIALPSLDFEPGRVAIDLDPDADLRNAGPWIGGTPTTEHKESVAEEAWPETDSAPVVEDAEEAIAEAAEEPVAEPTEAITEEAVAAPVAEGLAGPAESLPVEEVLEDVVAEPVATFEVPTQIESVAEPIEAPAIEEPVAAVESVAAEVSGAPLAEEAMAFEPGLNLDEQIAAYERRIAAESVPAEAVPEARTEPEPVAAEAERVAAEPETELVAAEVEPEAPAADLVVAAEQPLAAEAAPVQAEVRPEAVQPEPAAAVQPEPVVAEAEPEQVVAEVQPEPVAAEVEPEPAAAEVPPEPIQAPAAPEPAQELPVAPASTPQAPIEPIPTAIGKPLPASVVDGPLAWPVPDIAAAAFEQQWPDIPAPRVPTPSAPTPTAPVPPPPAPVQQAQQPPSGGVLRRTGANLPSVTAPPPILAARACPSCGLSLSASARFCRRCGTPQQADAVR